MTSKKAGAYKAPGDDTATAIELDPNNNGSIVRKAFLLESILNLFSLPLVTHPRSVLPYLLIDGAAQITPATVLFARSLGVLVVSALTFALWTGVPNTRTAIESRRTVYIMLGAGEVALIPVLVMEALKDGGRGATLSVKASLVAIMSLAPLLVWRSYVLFVKPNMIGRYREVKRE